MKNVSAFFGSMVFNDRVMRERLPKEVYNSLRQTMDEGLPLSKSVADIVAGAMKDWAISLGATHYTHWFQPMTGVTAEKHDSFISPVAGGEVIMEFSGKELVKGEPDASSFPSGGLRATFEARGYTAWDPTSFAFVRENSLYIPSAFCSYSGEVLDKKTPLLRSMQAINKQATRIINLFGANVKRVTCTIGCEQEYFLVDKNMYDKRPDLIFCGRTLIGAKPPKGQELEDHYFGAIKPRVAAYMSDLDETLWKLGISAKTKHNEVAPGQHELAPVYNTANIASDHNQLTMECMKTVALKHGLVCLLHEKPFTGINGSGKHNNWSLQTDTGANLFEPGDTPEENAQFLLFLTAIIKAVDEYQDLLRVSVATAGNDHRLGANEAPPAIISIFLGDQLTEILESLENGVKYNRKALPTLEIGVDALPRFAKDNTDRNRTSPIAFTGNKFEFRSVGSAQNVAGTNIVINTIVADTLREFADVLEKADDFTAALNDLIKKTIKKHKRIIFNGNSYCESWTKEAEKRGLLNLKTTADALPYFNAKKNVELFVRNGIFTEHEVLSRQEILFETYCKVLNIEGLTLIDMVKRDIIPAVNKYSGELAKACSRKKELGIVVDDTSEYYVLNKINGLSKNLLTLLKTLEDAVAEAKAVTVSKDAIFAYRNLVIPAIENLRVCADELETLVAKKYWPYPTYGEILYSE